MTASNQNEIDAVKTADSDTLAPVKALSMPDMAAEIRRGNASLRMAQMFVIANNEDYEMAGQELREVKAKLIALEEKRQTVSGPLHKAWTAFNAMFKAPKDALDQAEAALKSSMLAYSAEQERLALIERQRAEKIAAEERKRVEDEARRIEQVAAAERQRLAKIETDRQAAAQTEQDRLAAEAQAAMASGNAEAAAESERLANEAFERDQLAARQAAEIAEQSEAAARAEAETARMTAAVISAPVAYVAPAKAAGISVSKGVDYEMADLLELVKHIAAGNHDLISLVRHDDVKMRAYVKGLGMNTKLPGVRVFEKRTMAARS